MTSSCLTLGKSLEGLFDRISGLQVIEETSRRHTGVGKNGFTAKNVGVLSDDTAHVASV